jgi:hypothetical protein
MERRPTRGNGRAARNSAQLNRRAPTKKLHRKQRSCPPGNGCGEQICVSGLYLRHQSLVSDMS